MLQRIGSELVQRHAERLHCARLERERRSRNLDLETVIENAELGFEKFPNPNALPLLLSKQIERCGDSPESFVKDIAEPLLRARLARQCGDNRQEVLEPVMKLSVQH